MKEGNQLGLSRLKDLVGATCLRRTISGLGAATLQLPLPDYKTEWLELGNDEKLYKFFKRKTASVASGLGKRRARDASRGDENILSLLNLLRLVCDYGERMLPAKALEAWRDDDPSSIDWQAMETMRHMCAGCGGRVGKVDDRNLLSCGHCLCVKCRRRIGEVDEEDAHEFGACFACRDPDQTGVSWDAVGSSQSAKAQALIRNILGEQSASGTSLPQKR